MKSNSWLETCAVFCCVLVLLFFVYLFWDQYSTTLKAGDVGTFIAAIGAFIAAGFIYSQFKEIGRHLSLRGEESQNQFQEHCKESQRHYNESRRQFQEQFMESQARFQEWLKEDQNKRALGLERREKSQERLEERFNDSRERFQSQFEESQKRFQEQFDETRKQQELDQERREESMRRSSLISYQNIFFDLYDREALHKELVAAENPSKSVPPALFGLLELIKINLLNQVIFPNIAKWNLELILREEFPDVSEADVALLKYNLKAALLRYGLSVMEQDDEMSDLEERQKFLEMIFKLKKIRVAEVSAEKIKGKLNVMDIASRV